MRNSPPVPRKEPSTPDVHHSSQGASSTWLSLATTNLGLPFKNRRANPRGAQIQRPLCCVPAHVTDHSHWIQSRSLLVCTVDYVLQRERAMWQPGSTMVVLSPKLKRGASKGCHARKHTPQYELGSTPIPLYITPLGASSTASESILLWRGRTRHLDIACMPSGKAS